MQRILLVSLLVVGLIVFNIQLSDAQIDELPPRPIIINGRTPCHVDSDCNGSCGLDPLCYWTCENNLCTYQSRPSWDPISNREAGLPDLPINDN